MKLVNLDGKFMADSREIAEMTNKRHNDLLRDIEGYRKILDQNATLRSDDFFFESSYEAGTGKTYKCFLLTRKGCDMVANKMIGEKGVLFTATYVTKFEEMEERQRNNVSVMSERKALIQSLKLTAELAEEFEGIKEVTNSFGQKIMALEAKVDEQITIDSGEQRKVQKAISRKVYEFESDPKQRGELFRQLYREIKDRWAVPSYRDVRRNEVEGLIRYIDAWKPKVS